RVLNGAEYGRAVVGPEADHRSHFGVLDECVRRVRLGAHAVCVVRAKVYDLDVRACERLFHALETLARVLRVGLADEDHYLPALRQRRLDQFARLSPGGAIVRADVACAVALRRRGRRALLLLTRAAKQGRSRGETDCERERRPAFHFRSASRVSGWDFRAQLYKSLPECENPFSGGLNFIFEACGRGCL